MKTKNWRIRKIGDDKSDIFFIEADLVDAEKNGHYPRVEVMQEDYGDHNGYTYDARMADAKLIISAPIMKDTIISVLSMLEDDSPDINIIKKLLLCSISDISNSDVLPDTPKMCKWDRHDFGMMGFHDYEYVTECGKNYDCDKVSKDNFCPNCGGKIN